VRQVAEAIGRHLGVPAVSLPAEQATNPFKSFPFITLDIPISSMSLSKIGLGAGHPCLTPTSMKATTSPRSDG
jgi:hypothetical protein